MLDATVVRLNAHIYLPVLIPWLIVSIVIAFLTYKKGVQEDDSAHVPSRTPGLKPLFLSKLSKTSQYAPREAYDLPPRPTMKGSSLEASFKRVFGGGSTSLSPQTPDKTGASVPKVDLPPPSDGPQAALNPWTTLSYAVSAALTIVSGIAYLHEAHWPAALIALGISISILPFSALVQRIRQADTMRGLSIDLAAASTLSVINGVIAWRGSVYAALALAAAALLVNTSLIVLSVVRRRSARQGRIRLPTTTHRIKQDMGARRRRALERKTDNRKTMSFFSGGIHDDMTTKTRPEEGEMGGEETLKEDGEPNSWLTSPSRSEAPMSSFAYSTEHTSSPATKNDSSNSWLTSSPSNGATLSSFSYGTETPPGAQFISQPILKPIRAKLNPSASPAVQDSTGEGPSILRTSDPFDLSALSGVVLRGRPGIAISSDMTPDSNEQTDSSFHSARDQDADQSFPRTVSTADESLAERLADLPRPTRDSNDLPRSRGQSTASRMASPLGEPPAIPLPLPPSSPPSSDATSVPRRSGSTVRQPYAHDARLSTSLDHFSLQYGMQTRPSLESTNGGVSSSATDRANTPFGASSVFLANGNDKRSTEPLLFSRDGAQKNEEGSLFDYILVDSTTAEDQLRTGFVLPLCFLAQMWISWILTVPCLTLDGSASSSAAIVLFLVACALPALALTGIQIFLTIERRSAASDRSDIDIEGGSKTMDETVNVTQHEPSAYDVPDLAEKHKVDSPQAPPKLPKTRWSSILKPKPSLSNFGYTYGQPFTERPIGLNQASAANLPRPATVMLLPSQRLSFVSAKLPDLVGAAKAQRRASAPMLRVQTGIEDQYRLSSQSVGRRSSHAANLTPRHSTHRFSQYSENSPAARSVHNAQLRTAQRAKVSAPPLMLGPAPPPRSPAMKLDLLPASSPVEDPSMFADAPEDDEQIAPRMSTDTFGHAADDDNDPRSAAAQSSVAKRRSFDLTKWLPGSRGKVAQDIEMTHIPPKHTVSASMTTSESHARTSCSTNRESLDLPPFRPSLDFIPVPPIPAKYATANLAAGRASLDFCNPDAVQSTPKGTPVSKDHKHNISLSHFASPNFMSEMKGFLEDLAKTPKNQRVALLQSAGDASARLGDARKASLGKRSDDSIGPIRGILKSKASSESVRGHELPPIPVDMPIVPARSSSASSANLSVRNAAEIPIRMRLSGSRVYAHDPEQLPVVPEGEETGHIAAISLPRSRFSTDVPASIGHDELSFQEDENVVDEMEKFLTSMESPQTSAYLGDMSNGNSMGTSMDTIPFRADLSTHNAAAALRRQNSKESLKLAKVMSRKQSSDTISTAYTRDSGDGLETVPSPSRTVAKRSSQRLSTRPTSYAGPAKNGKLGQTSDGSSNTNRHSLPTEPKSSEIVPSGGLRPLRILGQIDGNASDSRKSSTTPSIAGAGKKTSTASSTVSGRKSSDQDRSLQRKSWLEDGLPRANAEKRKSNARVLDESKRLALLRAMR